MKSLAIGLVAWAGLAAGASAATPDAQLTAPIHRFIDAFDKGDGKTAAAAHWTADLSIIDEVPPYVWRGPKAFESWANDLTANDKKLGITGEKVTLGPVMRTEVDGAAAYVVMAAVYSFKDHGAPMREPAQMTFALRKGPGGWKISAWTWTGPKPTPAR